MTKSNLLVFVSMKNNQIFQSSKARSNEVCQSIIVILLLFQIFYLCICLCLSVFSIYFNCLSTCPHINMYECLCILRHLKSKGTSSAIVYANIFSAKATVKSSFLMFYCTKLLLIITGKCNCRQAKSGYCLLQTRRT